MPHAHHHMHENSLRVYRESVDKLKGRALMVFAYVTAHGPVTDRDIMTGLSYTDPNMVRPRVSELVKQGLLRECGNVKDPVTRKMVRTVDIATLQPELF